ncbi:hypothetical protein W97_01438 [Coniosporium apollinis CBS 100218]|uniref:Uncharacterized protein n=1 Tax=Coniosporium apollinis (strain CBS 100218) TaxID=1168221 RepID=R7YJW5_CONA1|nr:uncharacterized protein W97_01438 [Coniosporium apollinis CBS 100218]EON62217.1 hypothetical protein W97_01438 [Coniosporium apollinis CBS 100218]
MANIVTQLLDEQFSGLFQDLLKIYQGFDGKLMSRKGRVAKESAMNFKDGVIGSLGDDHPVALLMKDLDEGGHRRVFREAR